MQLWYLVKKSAILYYILFTLYAVFAVAYSALSSLADDSVCARVKIEIQQEMTLERQAFDAHMRINNGLSHIILENVRVEVLFYDRDGNSVRATSDPNDTTALFFIRLNSMANISGVDGTGTVQPSSAADIHWLIIPAPGASNGLEQGELYYVGATLSYTIGGEAHTTTVSPDYIFVKPMPEMVLEYFLPTDVYGDDAFTPEVEAPVPFSLGLRITNNGQGTARSLKIDSAQPKIVENEQGLLIGFNIEGTEVNGVEVPGSLLADFGDLLPSASAVTRWIMTCSLSGTFVDFTAEFSHSDELGGELTSLIDAVNTHFLVRDVLVDLPGRDTVRDFLARDGALYRVFESETVDSQVLNQSASASLQPAGQTEQDASYTLTVPATAGFLFVQVSDPQGGQKVLKEIVRSDGKRIKAQNGWLSKTRSEDHSWRYFFNLLDVNTTTSYTVVFTDPEAGPRAPVLEFIPDRTGVEGGEIAFIIRATDPDGTVPQLSAASLPALAAFTDQGDGTGLFSWTPGSGQAGRYDITYMASDGALSASQKAAVTVCAATDSDCDGLPDAWEMAWFGTLDRDGTGDADGDGVSDRQEYLNDTNPVASNAPTVPVIDSPLDGTETASLQPDLTIRNSTDPDNDPVTYEFELYGNRQMTQLLAQATLSAGLDTTTFAVPEPLGDNAWYAWRVRAGDGVSTSQWVNGSFFVNTENDPPGSFAVSSPQDGSEVTALAPLLQVTNSVDVDEDVVTYGFRVYGSDSTNFVASVSGIQRGEGGVTSWQVEPSLTDNTWYAWQATATDEHGASTATPFAFFFVNQANDAPTAPTIQSPLPGSETAALEVDLTVENASDQDGDRIAYFFECDRVNTFDSTWKRTSPEIAEGIGATAWHISGLEENSLYFWRAKASDGIAESPWATGSFFVNLANDAPTAPTVRNPGHGSWVNTTEPLLELNPSLDADRDILRYRFEVYGEQGLSSLMADGESDLPSWTVSPPLLDNSWYFWRAQAEDEHGAVSPWMQTSSFFANNNGLDDPPEIMVLEPAQNVVTNAASVLMRWEDTDPDSNASIDCYYATTLPATDGRLIAAGIEEDADGDLDGILWDTSAVSDGTYYLYAVIRDANNARTSYAPGAVTIDRTPPIVQAAPAGGTYASAQSVTLSANEAATLYYTLDGSTPTPASPVYGSPLQIAATTTVRFMAVDDAGNQSAVTAQTYVIQGSTNSRVSGGAYNYPQTAAYKATFSINVTGPASPSGWLKYYYARTRMNFASTAVTGVSVSGSTATITGTGTVNGLAGYTFTATVTDGLPDAFGLVINRPDGTSYYTASPTAINGGDLAITSQ